MTAKEVREITEKKTLNYIHENEPDLVEVLKEIKKEADQGNSEYVFNNEKHDSLYVKEIYHDGDEVWYKTVSGWTYEFKNKDKVSLIRKLGYNVTHNVGRFFCDNKITISW